MNRPVSVFGAIVLAATLLSSARAAADITKDQCVDANASAQPLRRAGKLAAARDQLEICVDWHCPNIVRTDCLERLEELRRVQPTIVFNAQDEAQNEIKEVAVSVDGEPLADGLYGTPLPVDPGEHAFTFTVPGQPPVVRRFVVREGEKRRHERVVVHAPSLSASAPALAQHPSPAAGPEGRAATATTSDHPKGPATKRGTLAVIVGSVGVAGIALGAGFGLVTISSSSQSKRDCSSSAKCNDYGRAVSERDGAITAATIADIGFIAGGALLAGGVALWLSRPIETAPQGWTARVAVLPALGRASVGIAAIGEF